MAVDTTITENVDLAVNGSALDPAFKKLNDQLNSISRKIVEIGASAQNSANGVNKKFDLELKRISRTLQQVSTLEKLLNEQTRQGSRGVSAAAAEQSLGRRAVAASKYEQSLRSATSATEALEARQNALIAKSAKIASEGLLPNKAFLTTKRNVDQSLSELRRLEREFDVLDKKARAAGGDYSPQRSNFQGSVTSLRGAATDNRRSNFTNELDQIRAALNQYRTAFSNSSASPAQQLNFRKRMAADEIRALGTIEQLTQARVNNEDRLRVVKAQIASGEAKNLRILHDELAVEDAISRAVARRTREMQQQNNQKTPTAEQLNFRKRIAAAEQSLGRRAVAASKYEQSLRSATNATEALEARQNALIAKSAKMASEGLLPDKAFLTTKRNVDQSLAELRRLEREFDVLDKKARAAGGDYSPQRSNFQGSVTSLHGAATDNHRSNFTNELDQIRVALNQYRTAFSDSTASPTQQLNFRKRMAADEIRALGTIEQLNQARVNNEDRLRVVKAQIASGEAKNLRILHDELAVEDAISRAVSRRTQELQQQNNQKIPTAQQLNFRKRMAADEIHALGTIEQLTQARVGNEERLRIVKAQIASGEAKNLRILHDELAVEDAISRAVTRRTRELQQQNSQKIPTAQPAAGAGSILPAGGIGTVLARTAAYGGAAAAIYGTIGLARDGFAFISEFEDGLGKLQAITGSTNTQMVRLSETILTVSRNSRYATSDLVDAATVLAQAGLSTGEIAKSLESVSQLASASGSTLQQTTDVVTSALGSFQLGAEQTAHVSDVLTTSLNNSKLNLEQVALGIQYAGQTAHENNISFEQLVATIATMSQAGIRSGSTQGTGLRQFLVDLQSPSKKLSAELKQLGISFEDINVKTRGLPAVLSTLAAKGFDASAAYRSLETRGAAAYLVLKNNTDEIQRQTIAQQQFNTTADASEKAMNTLTAQWQRFKNTIGAAVNEEGGGIFSFLTKGLKQFNDDVQMNIELQKKLNQLSPGTSLLQNNYRSLFGNEEGRKARDINEALDQYRQTLEATKEQHDKFVSSTEPLRTAIADTDQKIQGHETTLRSLDESLVSVKLRQGQLKDGSLALKAETATLTAKYEGLGIQLGGTVNSVGQLTGAMYRLRDATAQALQASYYQQLGQLSQQSALSTQNITTTAQSLGQRNITFRGKSLGPVIAGLNSPDQNIKDQSAQYLQSILPKLKPEFAIPVGDALASFGTRGLSGFQRDNLDRDYRGLQFMQTKPGKMMSDAVDGVIGGDEALKIKVNKALQDVVDNNPNADARAGALLLQQRLLPALTNTAPAPAPAKNTGANAAVNRANRNETFVSKDNLSLIEDELKDQLDRAKKVTSETLFENLTFNIQESLDQWISATKDVAKDELVQKKVDPNSSLGKRYQAQTERRIQQKRDEVAQALVESFIANIERQLQMIDDEFSKKQDTGGARLNILQGRVSGLDRYSLRNKVTEGDRVLAQRDSAREEESVNRSSALNLGVRLRAAEAERAKVQDRRDNIAAALGANPGDTALTGQLELAGKELTEIDSKLRSIRIEKEALDAAFEAGKDLPRTFGESLKVAVDAYSEANNLNRTFTENIQQGLYGAVGQVHGAFTSFFSDLTSGTMSVSAAFGNMALSILKSLQQMAAQAAASSIFGALLKFAGAAIGGSSGLNANDPLAISFDSAFPVGKLYGGRIQGFDGGGKVMNGSPGRDSVHAKLAKDEWVMQRSAVQSVGDNFMADLNNRGAAALDGLGPNVMMQKSAPTLTNVYVVAPEHKQQMGPNDVLLTFQDDVLRGGVTKQLIRTVAAGG